jgi:hypothetical protein
MGIPEDVSLLEHRLEDLIVRYEQYFLGVERREPLKLLKEVEQLARKYQGFQIVNTMMKFRYFSSIARLNSYKQYWGRTLRLIEEGKYSRDRFKMEMHSRPAAGADSASSAGTPEQPPVEQKFDPQVERLYQSLVEARRACRLPIDNLDPKTIAAAIEKQKPLLMKKYNCSDLDFKVVIEEGAPKIKARPKPKTAS